MEIQDVVVVSAVRTALGDFLGALKTVQARDLAITAGREAIRRSGISADKIDEICMGQIFTALQGSLPARQVAIRLGMADRSGAVSVNQNCASGMRALEIAAHNIMLGKTEIALVVAVESMTNAPYILAKGRMGYKMGPGTLEDHMYCDGLIDELVPGHMGVTAENVGLRYHISRKACDEQAVMSHMRAKAAIDQGRFKREIVPVEIKSKNGTTFFDTDEHVDGNLTMEAMAEKRPAFSENGVVNIGNVSGVCDGAAAAVVMSKKKAAELGIRPMMKLINVCTEGIAPDIMGLGPAVAIPKCLKQAGMGFGDIDYWEINEAFAVQILGVARMLKEECNIILDPDFHNHNGSGISLGHPVGCTGLRLIVTLYYEMERLGLTTGGASLCVGGGPAMASLWTREV
ncbi:Acetyl-CoA acetyltransferase [uncultured Desulfobacterium sp.]|uniref:Acetyl-CoA acetyltransferase n=1 Tax=uncultured Desulfobacterium sp. TaxID=201089 RepID=A0A445MRL3_9BACT|nr:Acetyl-CoA acetyltransferase [uncultured Desulfobacterium sp.]